MKLSKQEYETIIMVLREVIKEHSKGDWKGLCRKLCDADCDPMVIATIAKHWTRYSGNSMFPIPCPNDRFPVLAYREAYETNTMYVGEYGKLRLELAQFIIDHCEQRIK